MIRVLTCLLLLPNLALALSCVRPLSDAYDGRMDGYEVGTVQEIVADVARRGDQVWVGKLSVGPKGDVRDRPEVVAANAAAQVGPEMRDQDGFFIADAYRFSGHVVTAAGAERVRDMPVTLRSYCSNMWGGDPCPTAMPVDQGYVFAAQMDAAQGAYLVPPLCPVFERLTPLRTNATQRRVLKYAQEALAEAE